MKLPLLSATEIIKALEKADFRVVRQKGSHISLYKRNDTKTYLVVVPNTSEVKRGTLLNILKQAGMSREDFFSLLK
ncbi:MAG TPA: type II toxin-antitoxin system HicA family toxin [Methanomicrobia archaeon]|nr:type II toxin-antitoxin system HicA family toxin [Methanomicrobia archaeon]